MFIAAQLFLTMTTLEATVGAEPEPLRVTVEPGLPDNKNQNAGPKQALGIPMGDPHQGSSHHPGPPGENAAVDTAAVFHQEGLKRAEKQHADQIT